MSFEKDLLNFMPSAEEIREALSYVDTGEVNHDQPVEEHEEVIGIASDAVRGLHLLIERKVDAFGAYVFTGPVSISELEKMLSLRERVLDSIKVLSELKWKLAFREVDNGHLLDNIGIRRGWVYVTTLENNAGDGLNWL